MQRGAVKLVEQQQALSTAAGFRIQRQLRTGANGDCVVEVKSVTLALGGGVGAFPDAVSLRGQKHLRELTALARAGRHSCLLFCVMHGGITRVRPADEIDPVYGMLLREASAAGVSVLAWAVEPTPQGLVLAGQLPVELDQPAGGS